MLQECFDMGFDAFFAKYLDLQRRAVESPDFEEAMTAYREDRPPNWN
jgi:enoyl-CoA hydratase/carnithine racemase